MTFDLPALPDKNFFNMGEVSRLCGVAPHTLRYWEKRAGIPRPARRSSGHRRYTKEDIEVLFRIKQALEGGEMTLAGARRLISKAARRTGSGVREESETAQDRARAKTLQDVRTELRDLLGELSSRPKVL